MMHTRAKEPDPLLAHLPAPPLGTRQARTKGTPAPVINARNKDTLARKEGPHILAKPALAALQLVDFQV